MPTTMDTLTVDPYRTGAPETGVYVRARSEGKMGSHDIAHLDANSLLAWLRSRGGENAWAENTVGILLGHEEPIAPDAVPSRVAATLE